jgi:arginine repressor
MAKKRTTRTQSGSNGTSKAQAIRDIAKELGKKARPRDIVAALAAKGITVASAQVSTVLKAAGLRRGRRGRKRGKATAASNGHGDSFAVNELIQVKKLARQLGGTQRVKEVVAALERLI